ncbi:hypothetical protein CULT_90057 [[Clostridium] ultunense Esp]|nr:hypothetical protein CULT_90057 [[Clostridium] ultunense Esp]
MIAGDGPKGEGDVRIGWVQPEKVLPDAAKRIAASGILKRNRVT